MSNWFIRAITKDGKKFIKDYCQTEAIMIFKDLYEAAKNKILPEHKSIPHTWRTEIFKEFMDPKGVVVIFELCQEIWEGKDVCIFNSMWFEVDSEGRSQLRTQHHVALEYTFYGLTRAPGRPGDFIPDLIQHEMSGDWHMGYYEEPRELVIQKNRIPGDNSGVFSFKTPERPPPTVIDLSPKISTYKDDTAEAIHKHEMLHKIAKGYPHRHLSKWATLYNIYLNGRATDLITDNIGFMKMLHDYICSHKGEQLHSSQIPWLSHNIPQEVFDLITLFFKKRSFKIGAHPENEKLEDGNDASYSLFWDMEKEETIYVSPLHRIHKSKGNFGFDDVNF